MFSRQKALITGVTGQDGAYLARILLDKGYEVHGLRSCSAVPDLARLTDILDHSDFILHDGDMLDAGCLWSLLATVSPDEIYNLAALSHVGFSFAAPDAVAQVNGLGTLRLLEAMRGLGLTNSRFYQASSSELFGNAPAPQNENTAFAPCSPYATSKLYAYWTARNYRETYGLHVSNGILFNHESPLRGEEFVTQKIVKAACRIAHGLEDNFKIGNLDARRDWGHAKDYVRGMWMMLQQDHPDDYILATGNTHSVREFVEVVFQKLDMPIVWRGVGVEEKGYHLKTGICLIAVDPAFYRPADVMVLCGDASKAREKLGWIPDYDFDALIEDMLSAELETYMNMNPRDHYGMQAAE